MTELKRIREEYEIRLSESFLAAPEPDSIFTERENALEELGVQRDLTDLDALINDLMSDYERESTEVDRVMAVPLHKNLAIERRIAFDRRFWGWLGLDRYPRFIAWRWGLGNPRKEDGVRVRAENRYFGGHVRQTFARLWWAAELTVDGDGDYSLTEKLLSLKGFQDAYEAFFGRAFCQYRPALKAFIEVVGESPEQTIRDVAKEFGFAMSSRLLEALEENEIEAELNRILCEVKEQG